MNEPMQAPAPSQLTDIRQGFTDHLQASIAGQTARTVEQPAPTPAPALEPLQQELHESQDHLQAVPHAERPVRVEQEFEGQNELPLSGEDYVPTTEEPIEEEPDQYAGLPEEVQVKLTTLESENAELRTRVESVQKQDTDFRRKVNNLVTSASTMKTELDALKQQKEFAVQQAFEPLQRFQNVNMAQLTLEQQQQVNAEFQQAQQYAYAQKAQYDQFNQQYEQKLQAAEASQAEASLGVLRSLIPEWGEEKYRAAMSAAMDTYDYTAEEVEKEVDWRKMKMWNDLAEFKRLKEGGAEMMKQVGVQQKPPQPGRGTPRPQQRNHKGQFAAARDNIFKNPGNRDAMAAYFKARDTMNSQR